VIDKIRKGKNTSGLLYYLYGPGKSDEHTDPHLVAAWRNDLPWLEPPVHPNGRRDFRKLTGLLDGPLKMTGRHGQKDTVWHCVLLAAPEDRLMSDEQWNAIATEFMDLMGLAPRGDPAAVRWVAVRHGLSRNGIDHIHIAAALARQGGTIPSVHNDFLPARRACRQIEQKYGLTITAPADRTTAPRPSRSETERSARTGTPEPPRITLRHLAQDAAATALSEEDFFARLRDAGALIRFRYSDRNPGQVTGYALALPSHTTTTGQPVWFSGGKLAPDLTIPKPRSRWLRGQDRPGRHLSERSARAFLRSAACAAPERTSGENDYFTALNDAGILTRYRRDENGAVTGYSLSLTRPRWLARRPARHQPHPARPAPPLGHPARPPQTADHTRRVPGDLDRRHHRSRAGRLPDAHPAQHRPNRGSRRRLGHGRPTPRAGPGRPWPRRTGPAPRGQRVRPRRAERPDPSPRDHRRPATHCVPPRDSSALPHRAPRPASSACC
jgi:hypothetical protein